MNINGQEGEGDSVLNSRSIVNYYNSMNLANDDVCFRPRLKHNQSLWDLFGIVESSVR